MLVVTDEYSRFPIVEILESTSAKTVIPKLDSILSCRGIPDIVKSDNGPPFNGSDFSNYAKYMGFKHRKITPLWPRANGETERFMKTIKKSIKSSIAQGLSIKQEMNKFLLAYRATPHCSTGVPPATVFYGQAIKPRIPEIIENTIDHNLRAKDAKSKAKMKRYADAKRYVKPSDLKIGDSVIVKDMSLKKSIPYNPKPLTIVNKKGSMITAKEGDRTIVQNSSFFKRSAKKPDLNNESDSDDDNVIVNNNESVDSDYNSVIPPDPDSLNESLVTDHEMEQNTPDSPNIGRPQRTKVLPTKFKNYVMG